MPGLPRTTAQARNEIDFQSEYLLTLSFLRLLPHLWGHQVSLEAVDALKLCEMTFCFTYSKKTTISTKKGSSEWLPLLVKPLPWLKDDSLKN